MNIDFKKIFLVLLVGVFIVANFSFVLAADDEDDIKKDIDKIEEKIEDTEKDLQKTQVIYQQKQNQVYSTSTEIKKTETEISRREDEIKSLENKIKLDKKILGDYVRQLYMEDQNFPIVKFLMNGEKLSESFSNFDSFVNLKEKIIEKLKEISEMKEEVVGVKEELAEKKDEHEELLSVQLAERNKVGAVVYEKKLTLAELNAKLNRLRSTLSSFLGSYFSMDDVIDAVKYADKKTGVRKEFLFAVLDKETDLGRFTGGVYI